MVDFKDQLIVNKMLNKWVLKFKLEKNEVSVERKFSGKSTKEPPVASSDTRGASRKNTNDYLKKD